MVEQAQAQGAKSNWPTDKLGIRPTHALNPILTIFGTWGYPTDVFSN